MMDVDGAAATAPAPNEERRQSLQQQGVELSSTIQEDVDGFENVLSTCIIGYLPDENYSTIVFSAVWLNPRRYETT